VHARLPDDDIGSLADILGRALAPRPQV